MEGQSRDDHVEILRSRERLHKVEGTTAALVLNVEHLNSSLAAALSRIEPILEEAAYAKRRRAASLATLAVTSKVFLIVASFFAAFEGAWKVFHG